MQTAYLPDQSHRTVHSLDCPCRSCRSLPGYAPRFAAVIDAKDVSAIRAGIALGLAINAVALAVHFGPALIAALSL